MNLQEFVTKVIVDLDRAVDEANKLTLRNVGFQFEKRTVDFDIAVTVDNSRQVNGKATGDIKVLGFMKAEAGVDASLADKNSTVSRVSFAIQIDPQTRKEKKEDEKEWEEINSRNNDSAVNLAVGQEY